MTLPLDGRVALVTGAGRGLGLAIAASLADAGAAVVLAGRSEEQLAAARLTLREPERHRIGVADVTNDIDVARLVDDHPDVSILVNNAGVGGPVAPIEQITPAEWDAVFAANVRSIFLLCSAFLPAMYERGDGDVINIASVTGKRPLIRRTPYAASKMAVLGLTRTLAFESAPRGVRVNSLSPGPVRGVRMDRNFDREAAVSGRTVEAVHDEFVGRAALNRLVEEAEVGEAVVAMLAMRALCGADIDLSAGMVAPS